MVNGVDCGEWVGKRDFANPWNSMMKSKIIVLALLASIASTAVAEARGPFGSIKIGNWSGGAWTDDQTGDFSR